MYRQLDFPHNNFAFDGTVHGKAEETGDFALKSTLNSEALKLNEVVIEAHKKGTIAGKKIEFKATAAGKNILSGL